MHLNIPRENTKFSFSSSITNVVTKDDNELNTVRKRHTMKAYRGHGGKAQPLKTISAVINDKTPDLFIRHSNGR